MALTSGRNTPRRSGDQFAFPVAAATTIYAGGMVTLLATGGYAVPAGTASAGVCVGMAEETVVNTGAAGDLTVPVRRGVFRYANSASGDLIARADIGNVCYLVDDQTVAKTDNSAARKEAGVIVDVDAVGVWVRI
ncbi:MAG TPA: hypothetical protein VLF18_08690 [Tahibacter sp.]|uniref:hypothetical protein n=1 Tax=Tahibacter sp. TaxID=2056211 RepID=UPI002C0F5A91|nr:hypothetical protein [Tahibacter sp.]HSX60261.1 hypothetical protein [Tahibacter sp.]